MRLIENVTSFPRLLIVVVFAFGMSLALSVAPVAAEGMPNDGEFHLGAELYMWGSSIGGHTANGEDIDISFEDIVENLEFAAMGAMAARKGDLWLLLDGIYLDAEKDGSRGGKIEVQNTLLTTAGGYTVLEGVEGRLDFLAGARMLYLKADVSGNGPQGPFDLSDSGTNWNAIVGARGELRLIAENFFLPYYIDIGGGDSELTWQALGGMGYSFEKFNLLAGYRYLDYETKNNPAVDSIDISGAYVGVSFLLR